MGITWKLKIEKTKNKKQNKTIKGDKLLLRN
jgi:hypothetical protein